FWKCCSRKPVLTRVLQKSFSSAAVPGNLFWEGCPRGRVLFWACCVRTLFVLGRVHSLYLSVFI
ncbi:unnamed protein product, partial [Amoebophrya sp. A25]